MGRAEASVVWLRSLPFESGERGGPPTLVEMLHDELQHGHDASDFDAKIKKRFIRNLFTSSYAVTSLFFYLEKLWQALAMATTSFPKNKIHILALENVHSCAVKAFQKEGFQVEVVEKLSEQATPTAAPGTRSTPLAVCW